MLPGFLADLGMKTRPATGLIEGPDVLTVTTIFGQTGGHNDGRLANSG